MDKKGTEELGCCKASRNSSLIWLLNRIFLRTSTPFVSISVIILGSLVLLQYKYMTVLIQEQVDLTQGLEGALADLEVCRTESSALLSSMDLEAIRREKKFFKINVGSRGFKGQKLVHIDLKGAPPSMDYLLQLLPYFKKLGATGILLEYEDMFPYKGKLRVLSQKYAYSYENIQTFLKQCKQNNLDVIPLVQTFGHFEFALKHKEFAHLRETPKYPNAPCPLKYESQSLVYRMIDQVLELHPNIDRIHVGGDEIFNLGDCSKCRHSNKTNAQLYLNHMLPILSYVIRKSEGKITPIIWDDMLRKWSITDIKKISSLAEIMIWGYVQKLEGYSLFTKDMWDKYSSSFSGVWIASSFKGAIRPDANLPPLTLHIENHLSWLKIIRRLSAKTKVIGVALTGWARYDHFATLCETLPAGIPSLALCLRVLMEGQYSPSENRYAAGILGYKSSIEISKDPFGSHDVSLGKYPGTEVYSLVAELENFISWYESTKNRIESWGNVRQQKQKIVSPLQVEGAMKSMKELIPAFYNFRKKCEDVLKTIFFKDTVKEWIEDKVDTYIKQAQKLNKTLTAIIQRL